MSLAHELGGKGIVKYPQGINTSFFESGIKKIITLYDKSANIEVMCAECEEKFCYRRFIVKSLDKIGIFVKNTKSLKDWM